MLKQIGNMPKDMIQTKNGNYTIIFSKQAVKDQKLLASAGLENKAKEILNIMTQDPFGYPPSYEKLIGELRDHYSRRINIQHRIIYKVNEDKKEIYILRMWTHYENL